MSGAYKSKTFGVGVQKDILSPQLTRSMTP